MRKLNLFLSLLIVLSLLIPTAAFAQEPVLAGGNPDFNGTAAEEEGYWYSRYNMGNLMTRSGLGDSFMPDMAMMQQMIQMADADPNDGDTAMPPMNPTLLQSVYASGDPHYTQMMNVDDFATQSWDPTTFDKTVTTGSMGWTIIKAAEWGRQFHVDFHFGTPTDNFGAQWRFIGQVLMAEAKMQGQYALKNMHNEQGLYANSDGVVDADGQWVMLEALTDLGAVLSAPAMLHSETNRYADPAAAAMFQAAADDLFAVLSSSTPRGVSELSLALQSLTWYAAHTGNSANASQAVALISQVGDALVAEAPTVAVDRAAAIRGLIEAYRVGGNSQHLDSAAQQFGDLATDFDAPHGVFNSQSVYTIDDIGVILGALNSLKLFAGDAVNQAQAEAIFTDFFQSAINLSGMQQSAPPKNVAKDAFEQEDPDIYYAYPGLAMPPMAGGEFGIAPVFAAEVTWDGSQWSVTNARFDSAGAMHAANEFIWFHNDEVDGFPVINVTAAPPEMLPVTGGSAAVQGANYVVAPSDSLYKIASELLSNGSRWPELYSLNMAVIGDNPRLIRPGQRFVLPQ